MQIITFKAPSTSNSDALKTTNTTETFNHNLSGSTGINTLQNDYTHGKVIIAFTNSHFTMIKLQLIYKQISCFHHNMELCRCIVHRKFNILANHIHIYSGANKSMMLPTEDVKTEPSTVFNNQSSLEAYNNNTTFETSFNNACT